MTTFIAIVLYGVACGLCLTIGKVVGDDIHNGYDAQTSPNAEGVGIGAALAALCFVAASCLVIWG